MQLGGVTREYARALTPQELSHGGIVNGVQVDPVTYLLSQLQTRFAPFEEEIRLCAMTEMVSVARRPGEDIDQLLTRYELVRARAASEGQFRMSVEGCAWQILRACGVGGNQLLMVLQPYNGNVLTTEQQLQQMVSQIRRMWHIVERSKGNIASTIHGPTEASTCLGSLSRTQY